MRGHHGGSRLGRGRGLGQDGGFLVGAGSGSYPDGALWFSRVPVVQEARAGVVSRAGPAVGGGVVVEVMRERGVVEVFGVRELEGALTGVMEMVGQGGVVAGTGTGVVGGGWGGLVDGGEGF